MNRFKFRVWDNQKKRMFIPIGNLYPENPDDFNFPTLWQEFNTDFANVHGAYGSFPMEYWFSKDCIIQQFTGLLDKNGKEIYEGDIVRVFVEDNPEDLQWSLDVVSYKDGAFVLDIQYVWSGESELLHDYQMGDKCDLEVVGNVYENPELVPEFLKEK